MQFPDADAPLPKNGTPVPTACRGYIMLAKDTTHVVYHGKRIFFCLPSCRRSFENDPQTSCMAGDPLLEE